MMPRTSESAEGQSIKNLWGTLPIEPSVLAPVAILKQPGEYLARATNGLLTVATSVNDSPDIDWPDGRLQNHVKIIASRPPNEFRVTMYLIATALNNYRFQILEVTHGIELYPARVNADPETKTIKCANQEEFEQAVERVLQSDRVRRAIIGLLAQMRSN